MGRLLPTLIKMIFIPTGHFRLPLWAVSQMVPNVFASAHVNWAAHGMSNLRSMESLPTDVWPWFLQGQMFVVHHIQHGLTCLSNQHSCGMGIVKVSCHESL